MFLQGYGSLIVDGTLATIQLALLSMLLAVTLDRITQAMGRPRRGVRH